MAGNTFGKNFTVTTWGESHGPAIGAVIDGCPAGLSLSEEDIQPMLDRRHGTDGTNSRQEKDNVKILSGVLEGKTLGTPISLLIGNTDAHSSDYDDLKEVYRPGHADYTYDVKYGIRDWRGGGRSSGRETASRIAAGAVAIKILNELGITISSQTTRNNELPASGDSVGGSVEISVKGMPAGIGEPVFEKLDAELSKGIMSIGAVKAVEIGCGAKVASMTGSTCNDGFILASTESLPEEDSLRKEEILTNAGKAGSHYITKKTNHAGGILGGISDGDEIILRAFFKPTPSISSKQQTVDAFGHETEIEISGRHDSCIAQKGAVAAEAMTALTIVDLLFENMHSKMSAVSDFYK
ncbi:MAG: chorismate synthase [Lachnospiraceae bacterium]|nr:chorismate synthase [Lachnospiraceae bacterium]